MFIKKLLQKRGKRSRGQTMVEFALAFPIFLLIIIGIVEFGRLFITYTSVFAAAREGARYGSAVENLTTCGAGIEGQAERAGFLAGDLNVTILYDSGPGTSTKPCNPGASNIKLGDRVLVTTSMDFNFITGLIPVPGGAPINLRSTAKRTIIKQAYLRWTLEPPAEFAFTQTAIAALWTPTDTPDPSWTATPTATNTPTPTNTPTVTPTPEPQQCESNWNLHETVTTFYIDITFTNPFADNYYTLGPITISWNTTGQRQLNNIDFAPPNENFYRLWTGPRANSSFTWVPPTTIGLKHGTSTVRFVFVKKDTEVYDINLQFLNLDGQSCYIRYDP